MKRKSQTGIEPFYGKFGMVCCHRCAFRLAFTPPTDSMSLGIGSFLNSFPLELGFFLFLGSILLLFYLLCLKVGLLDMFWELLSRTGSFLLNRALSPFLLKIGCSSDLALLIGFLVKASSRPGRQLYLCLRLERMREHQARKTRAGRAGMRLHPRA